MTRRARRRQRGATSLEYVVILVCVFVPSVAAAVLCFEHVAGWYLGFVAAVSRVDP